MKENRKERNTPLDLLFVELAVFCSDVVEVCPLACRSGPPGNISGASQC